jgi:hypothetical protein
MNSIFASPTTNDQPLDRVGSQSGDEDGEDENSIRVKLFFYCDSKALRNRVFPEEWYTMMADEFDADDVDKDVY